MKKIIAALLCINLLLLFSGCFTEMPQPTAETTLPTHPTETIPPESTEETQPLIIEDIPLQAFSAPIVTYEHRASDGATLFSYSFQNISLILEDPQIADAIVIDLLNYIDYENAVVQSILSDAKDAYSGQKDWSAYTYSTLFSPERFDQSILSLYGVQVMYNGSPRPTTSHLSVTYDLLSGRPLALTDILENNFSADDLSQCITNALGSLADQGMLYSDYAYVVSELFSTNRPVENWYFSDSGLCFYFAPYEIAPYSAGTIIAEVPYEALTGILLDAYFPEEHIHYPGTLFAQSFQDADTSRFQRFAELILSEDAAEYLLYTDGCLRNVRIEIGVWMDDSSFLPQATIFAADALSDRDGLMIQFEAEMPQDLCITYEENGEPISMDLKDFIINN